MTLKKSRLNERLEEVGLKGEQIPRAREILRRGSVLMTWTCGEYGVKRFAEIRKPKGAV